MRNALTIAGAELRLFLRDRSNLFFVFVFPLLLVLMIGLQFGEGATSGRVAVSGGESSLQSGLVERLEADDVVVSDPAWDDALALLARGRLDVAVRVDAAAAAAYEAGEAVTLEVVRGPLGDAQVVEQDVRVAVEALRSERSRVLALETRGVPTDRAQEALATAEGEVSAPRLEVTSVDRLSQEFEGMGQFEFGAAGQLLLFVFLACLGGSATLIQARRLGVVSRMLAGPVAAEELVAGQVLGRWAIGLFQGAYLMVASSLLFGVGWGSVPLALLVLLLFSLVAAGAAILLGTLLENEGAAAGAGIGAGLVLAALGGSMFPLELFPDTMRTISRLTPHSWAYEALADVQRRGAGFVEVLPELGVLAAMAAVLVTLGSWSLRRSLARAM
ncbi:ABC transporter permease [Nocardioides cavernae]|uniref:ABC transporter permease n=1 Tax=Nocardioides cavernae TaxID=1921566 RepID=A0ABR8N7M1_9ACTN|nr:ABC transporter permease [Nocardioides cavernae]MBD3923241.1 ABC transporter permease [Nocardioides cavernae]MBM7511838.1 ABC-2 type transport system permease protein [Nocardioides cavernae]